MSCKGKPNKTQEHDEEDVNRFEPLDDNLLLLICDLIFALNNVMASNYNRTGACFDLVCNNFADGFSQYIILYGFSIIQALGVFVQEIFFVFHFIYTFNFENTTKKILCTLVRHPGF